MSADAVRDAGGGAHARSCSPTPIRSRPRRRSAQAVAAAGRVSCTLIARPEDEIAKHGEAVAGIEDCERSSRGASTSAWCSAGTARSSRRCAPTPGPAVPVFAVNFGTIGFLAAVERDELRAGSSVRSPATSRW